MFKNDQNEKPRSAEAETIIGPSVKVKGNFYGDGNMIIEGTVEGNVRTKNNLQVGDKAKITANIEAKDAFISGEVYGNIKIAGSLDITASAKIKGDVEAKTISIEKGAEFNGHCNMGGTNTREDKK